MLEMLAWGILALVFVTLVVYMIKLARGLNAGPRKDKIPSSAGYARRRTSARTMRANSYDATYLGIGATMDSGTCSSGGDSGGGGSSGGDC